MTAQSGLGFSGIAAIQIPDQGATGEVLTKLTGDNYDYDWLPGGGGGAPDDATYVVISLDATLTNERVLVAGDGLGLVDGGAGGNVTINMDAPVLVGTTADTILRWVPGTPAWEEFTAYILPLADGSDGQAIITDGAGTLTFGTVSGGGALSGQYRFSTSIVAADPGAGRFRYDAVAYGSVTQIFIDDFTNQGVDISNLLSLITTGDRLYIQAEQDSDEFAVWDVTAPITDNTGWFTIDVSLIANGNLLGNNDRTLVILQIGGAVVTLQIAYDNDTTVPQILVNSTPDPITIDASVVGDIFAVRDTIGQDMIRLSTTGGSVAGGSNAGNILTLEGALAGSADTGIVRSNSPIDIAYNTIDNTTPAQQFAMKWTPTFTASVAYIGGCLQVAPTVTISTATFIPATFSDTSNMLGAIAPGFSAFTFINELAVIRNSGNFNLMSALVMNIGTTHERNTSGTSTTPGSTGLSASFQTRTTVSGAVMTKTAQTAARFSPTFSTVAGSTVNLGTLRGLHCFNPAPALFQPAGGAEAMTAYIGLEMNAMPFGGNVTKRALRSALTLASNTLMIENTGGADSEFGSGDIHFNDNAGLFFGATRTTADMLLFWASASASLTFSTFFGTGGNPLQLVGTAADEWIFQQDSGGTLDIGIGFDVNAVVFGTTAPTPNANNWFTQFSAPSGRQVQIGGEYSDVLWTAGGFIDVNGLAVSDLQAFKINSVSTVLNGGTIADISNLYVQAMASVNFTTSTQALRVLGRHRLDGHFNQGSQSPAQLTANTNDWQLAANNNQRGVVLLTTDGLGPYNVTGIDAAVGRAQIGDYLEIINISADTITFTNQDVLSLAANRFITATGAGIAVAPNESIRFWYDDTGVLRWRHVQEQ